MENPPRLTPSQPEKSPERPHLDRESIAATAQEILAQLESLPGFTEYSDISRMYRELPNSELIVRRENPEALMHALETKEALSIQFVGNTPYANSVEWHPKLDGARGLDNAYLEGYGQANGVVLVYGFERPEGFYMEQHPESQQVFAGIDRVRVRSSAGMVPTENIRFVTVRVPLSAFPEARMTEEEKDLLWEYVNEADPKRPPAFVFRGFKAEGKEKAADLPMAA